MVAYLFLTFIVSSVLVNAQEQQMTMLSNGTAGCTFTGMEEAPHTFTCGTKVKGEELLFSRYMFSYSTVLFPRKAFLGYPYFNEYSHHKITRFEVRHYQIGHTYYSGWIGQRVLMLLVKGDVSGELDCYVEIWGVYDGPTSSQMPTCPTNPENSYEEQ